MNHGERLNEELFLLKEQEKYSGATEKLRNSW